MCEACPAMIDHNKPGAPSEAELERIIDRRVQRRLATDHRYLYAENAEEQAEAEAAIEREVCRELEIDA